MNRLFFKKINFFANIPWGTSHQCRYQFTLKRISSPSVKNRIPGPAKLLYKTVRLSSFTSHIISMTLSACTFSIRPQHISYRVLFWINAKKVDTKKREIMGTNNDTKYDKDFKKLIFSLHRTYIAS